MLDVINGLPSMQLASASSMDYMAVSANRNIRNSHETTEDLAISDGNMDEALYMQKLENTR